MLFYHAFDIRSFLIRPTMSSGVLAGLAGGTAEVVWIATYARISGGNADNVARGVTETLLPQLAVSPLAVPLGLAIHMGLAVVMGLAIAAGLRSFLPRPGRALAQTFPAVVAALAGAWVINFHILLPTINPDFVVLVPYWTSLSSKLLFGVAAAAVLHFSERPRHGADRNRRTPPHFANDNCQET